MFQTQVIHATQAGLPNWIYDISLMKNGKSAQESADNLALIKKERPHENQMLPAMHIIILFHINLVLLY